MSDIDKDGFVGLAVDALGFFLTSVFLSIALAIIGIVLALAGLYLWITANTSGADDKAMVYPIRELHDKDDKKLFVSIKAVNAEFRALGHSTDASWPVTWKGSVRTISPIVPVNDSFYDMKYGESNHDGVEEVAADILCCFSMAA